MTVPAVAAAAPETPAARTEHIVLYIEDNADNIRLVELLLTNHNRVALHVATTAQDGVDAAVALLPDLILLDNRLPDATGADVLRRLAVSAGTASIPVIILTGDSERKTAETLLSLGASSFLAKPFDIHAFLQLVDSYLV